MLDTVFKVASKFMKDPRHVAIAPQGIKLIAKEIQGFLAKYTMALEGPPTHIMYSFNNKRDLFRAVIAYELIANSINYQYWYGAGDIRVNSSSCGAMYKLFNKTLHEDRLFSLVSRVGINNVIDKFAEKLMLNRFPNITARLNHLKEVKNNIWDFIDVFAYFKYDDNDLEPAIKLLITSMPGYGSDIFLKRCIVFFMTLNKRMGWFANEIHKLPAPIDYHIPKMLSYNSCIVYNRKLSTMIINHEIISSGSLIECEIRAASIIACKQIAEQAGCTMIDVDEYLFARRKECKDPFHLTITTDY